MINVDRFVNEIKPYALNMFRSRMGPWNDGGYIVLPELSKKAPYLYTYGVGDDVGFEKDFIKEVPNAHVRLYDPTINELPEEHLNFHFNQIGIENHLWGIPPGSVVKIDVEGAEWDALAKLKIRDLYNWSQLIIELHIIHAEPRKGLSPYFQGYYEKNLEEVNNQLFLRYWLVLKKLNSVFHCFHVHANNSLPLIEVGGHQIPPLLEMSFVRKDLVKTVTPIDWRRPSITIDSPNKTDRPDINLEDIK